jgi:hypothetical protein
MPQRNLRPLSWALAANAIGKLSPAPEPICLEGFFREDSLRPATDIGSFGYYFYIFWSNQRHRFYTSIWGMLHLLGSLRHRVLIDIGVCKTSSRASLLATAGPCELVFLPFDQPLPGHDLIAAVDEP